MVVTHIPVIDALNKILQQKDVTAPQNTLLRGAYDVMVYSLKADRGAELDRDYIEGQVEYQKGNAASRPTCRSRMRLGPWCGHRHGPQPASWRRC
jgi:hypothetical protein